MQLTMCVLILCLVTGALAGMVQEATPAGDAAVAGDSLLVMSFNLRYDTPGDGENRWELRRDLVAQTIADTDADLVGVQEAYKHQLDELLAKLPRYACLGVGRDDGKESGEYSAILYDRERFEVEASGTFWLSDTPSEPGSKTWGNTIPRICTWARLREATGGRTLWMFNAHLDHASQPSRLKSVELIAQRAQGALAETPGASEDEARERKATGLIVTGDFNAGEKSEEMQPLLAGRVQDLVDTLRVLHPHAEAGTFNGFEGRTGGEKIDYVLANRAFDVGEAAIVRASRDGRYPSDHFLVTATLRWRSEAGGE